MLAQIASQLVALTLAVNAYAGVVIGPPVSPQELYVSQLVQDLGQHLPQAVRQQVIETIRLESKFHIKAHNPNDPEGGAIGVGQFLPSTFRRYAPLAGIINPDIWNERHQIQTMLFMFSIGEAKQWSCFRRLYLGDTSVC